MEQVNSLETGKKFKKTEIGEIPVDWEVVRIGDICEVVGGSTPSTNKKEYWNGDILWAVPTDITKLKGNIISDTEKKITEEGLSACAAKLLPEGSILLTSRATIGECAINTKPMATNQGFASLTCKENIYNWFIFYKVTSIRKKLEKFGSGSTFRETSKKSIRAIRISLPPLPEQKKIAEILTTVDEAIEKSDEVIEKTKELKKGLMQELLTRGIGHKKFKKTKIGEIPVDWEVAKLGDVAQINMGQSPPSVDCFDYKNGLPFFQGTAEFGTKYPTVNKWCNSPRKVAGRRDILVSVRAPVGDVNVAPEECCIGRGLAAIRGTKSDNSFLYFIMNFVKKSLVQIGQGSTFEAINKNVLFELTIPFPPLPEQKKIAGILSTVDEDIKRVVDNRRKLETIKKGLMQVLLTGKKRVKV